MRQVRREHNSIMKIIGHQSAAPLLSGGYKDLKFISDAYSYTNIPDALFDAFLLGIIYGKRIERLRKSKGE